MIEINQKIYASLFIISSLLFLISFLSLQPLLFSYTDFYGIIFKMDWFFWVGYVILLILIYFQLTNFDKLDEKYVYLTLLLIVIYLIGTPALFEHLPRFEDTWSHSFLSQEMFENKKVVNNISTYEQYPGTFLFFGFLFQIIPSFYIMKFFPPFLYFLGAIVVYVIFKHLFNGKISFLSSILYIFFNWTAEDNHISPQFLMLYIYFLFILVMVKFLSEKREKMKFFIITSLFSLVIVFSHPGTPIFLLLILWSMFVLCKKFRNLLLPVSTFLLVVFIIYHLYQITILESYIKMIKQFFEILLTGTGFSRASARFYTSILSRRVFITSRIGITIFSFILGLPGLILSYRKGYKLGTKFFFAWIFSMAFFFIFESFVSMGGFHERFVLISCLPLAALSAYFLLESKSGLTILIILLIISPVYFVAKYGNEAFESESVEKLKADCFYIHFDSNCEKRQEIVDSQLYPEIYEHFAKRDFTTDREGLMSASIYLEKNVEDVKNIIDGYSSSLKLDRIYSSNNAGTYR